MIEQTIPFAALTAGMARCVREWILPHLTDPLARVQAEQLATLIEGLPRSQSAAAAESIRIDTGEARAVLETLGDRAAQSGGDESVDALMRENAAVKAQLETLADLFRRSGEREGVERLVELQRFFLRSLIRELGESVPEDTDFESLTSRENAARRK